jgi:hypothetical protein
MVTSAVLFFPSRHFFFCQFIRIGALENYGREAFTALIRGKILMT